MTPRKKKTYHRCACWLCTPYKKLERREPLAT